MNELELNAVRVGKENRAIVRFIAGIVGRRIENLDVMPLQEFVEAADGSAAFGAEG